MIEIPKLAIMLYILRLECQMTSDSIVPHTHRPESQSVESMSAINVKLKAQDLTIASNFVLCVTSMMNSLSVSIICCNMPRSTLILNQCLSKNEKNLDR
jgi:hypothetical protein